MKIPGCEKITSYPYGFFLLAVSIGIPEPAGNRDESERSPGDKH